MSPSVNSQPLTFDVARDVSGKIQSFALEFTNADTGELKPLQWISDSSLVSRFDTASGLRIAINDEPVTALQQKAYIKTKEGKVYSLRLYKVHPDRPGIITFAGGSTKTSQDLYHVITEAYNLAIYSPREEARRARIKPESVERVTGKDEETLATAREHFEKLKHDNVQITDPFVIVVWSDNDHSSHNQAWAQWYLNLRPINTYTLQANGLAAIATLVNYIHTNGYDVRQIIMSVHGTEAEFDLRSPNDPFNSQYCCGLYAGQTTGTQYGNAVVADMVANPTITLLSCDTAGISGVTDGRVLMSQISTVLNGYVIASDGPVYVSNNGAPSIPYTAGNIFASVPGTPMPVIITPGGAYHNIPIQYF